MDTELTNKHRQALVAPRMEYEVVISDDGHTEITKGVGSTVRGENSNEFVQNRARSWS